MKTVLVLISLFSLFCELAFAQAGAPENRRAARELIEQRYYNSNFDIDIKEALKKLEQNFVSPEVAPEDYLLAAWIYFAANRGLGAIPEEEDIGQAINILNQATTKYPENVDIPFAKYYYSQFSKERFQREQSTKEVEGLSSQKKLTKDQLAIYSLKIGAINQSKTLIQEYLSETADSAVKRADKLERYGDILLASQDATLARSCLETYERAITERPEVAIYYVKAAVCATKGLNFDRAHLYYRNAYERQKESKPYKEAYAGSLTLQYVMKKDKWEVDKQVATLEEAFTLLPNFKIFALRFSLALEKEGDEAQKVQLARGEELFGEKVYELYIYLYQKTDVNFSANVKKDLLERIIKMSKNDREQLHFAFTSFLEDLTLKEELSYNRTKYARAFKLAKNYYKEHGATPGEVGIYSYLYLLQFFKTKDFKKLQAAASLMKQIENREQSEQNDIYSSLEKLINDLTNKISKDTGFAENGVVFKIKELLAPTLEESLGIKIFSFKLEEQEFSSLAFKESYKEEITKQFAPKLMEAEMKQREEASKKLNPEDFEEGNEEEKDTVVTLEADEEKKSNANALEFLKTSQELFSQKQYEKAVTHCLTGLNEEKLKTMARTCLTEAYHKLKDYQNALKYADELLTEAPKNREAVMKKAHLLDAHIEQLEPHRGFIYESHKEFPNSELTTAIKEKLLYQNGMDDINEYFDLANTIAAGRYSKTLKARTLMNVGNVHYTRQELLEAVKSYNSCTKIYDDKYSKKCKLHLASVCQKNPDNKEFKIYCLRS